MLIADYWVAGFVAGVDGIEEAGFIFEVKIRDPENARTSWDI